MWHCLIGCKKSRCHTKYRKITCFLQPLLANYGTNWTFRNCLSTSVLSLSCKTCNVDRTYVVSALLNFTLIGCYCRPMFMTSISVQCVGCWRCCKERNESARLFGTVELRDTSFITRTVHRPDDQPPATCASRYHSVTTSPIQCWDALRTSGTHWLITHRLAATAAVGNPRFELA